MVEPANIRIDRLQLQLPSGFELRAAAIGRHFADLLARLPNTQDLHQEHLVLPAVELAGGETDRAIADRMVQALQGALRAAPAKDSRHA